MSQQQLMESTTIPSPRSGVARVGRAATRVVLFVIMVGVLLDAASDFSLPWWLVTLVGAVVVGPLIYWPSLGASVLAAYLLVALIRH